MKVLTRCYLACAGDGGEVQADNASLGAPKMDALDTQLGDMLADVPKLRCGTRHHK